MIQRVRYTRLSFSETERQRGRETERQRDRETERQRDRETERQRDRGGQGGDRDKDRSRHRGRNICNQQQTEERERETDRQRSRGRQTGISIANLGLSGSKALPLQVPESPELLSSGLKVSRLKPS